MTYGNSKQNWVNIVRSVIAYWKLDFLYDFCMTQIPSLGFAMCLLSFPNKASNRKHSDKNIIKNIVIIADNLIESNASHLPLAHMPIQFPVFA